MRFRLLIAVVAATLGASLISSPAVAASKPAKVGLVSIIGGTVYTSGGKNYATVKLSWPKAKRATKYQVFVSRTKSGVARKSKATVTVKGTRATIKKLGRNRTYWFQVRAVNGRKVGSRSNRVARVTIAASPALSRATSPAISVMSYNVCSNACTTRPWSGRQPLVVNRVVALQPDVLAVQEASRWSTTIPGYTQVPEGNNDRLFYNTDVYEPVVKDWILEPARECPVTDEPPHPGEEPCEPSEAVTVPEQVNGRISTSSKEAPWALLRRKDASGQYVVFVSVHLLTGNSDSAARTRALQMRTIFAQLDDQMASWREVTGFQVSRSAFPVVFVGDFNTNRSRSNNSVVENELRKHGYFDAYEQARSVTGQHYNTGNPDWRWRNPVIGVTWGDHVDKVWVRASRSRVLSWANVGAMSGGRYIAPLPSDHHPILVTVQVS